MAFNLRKRSRLVNYSEDGNSPSEVITIDDIKSTSSWNDIVTQALKINVIDIEFEEIKEFVEYNEELSEELRILCITEWVDENWLEKVNISTLNVSNKLKTLIAKIKDTYIQQDEVYIDGYMNTLLHIMNFDDYPFLMYPQFKYSAVFARNNHVITAKSDFTILCQSSSIVIVVEDKNTNTATYANNWKEDQVLGELFVTVHNMVAKSKGTIVYPVNIYAIRVVRTLFTFYKTIASLEYIKETAKGLPHINTMSVLRHPPVFDDPSELHAYDFCCLEQRKKIIYCMHSIRSSLS